MTDKIYTVNAQISDSCPAGTVGTTTSFSVTTTDITELKRILELSGIVSSVPEVTAEIVSSAEKPVDYITQSEIIDVPPVAQEDAVYDRLKYLSGLSSCFDETCDESERYNKLNPTDTKEEDKNTKMEESFHSALDKLTKGIVLSEISSSKNRVYDILHKLGQTLIAKASQPMNFKGAKENDVRLVEVNKMSRIGEMLVTLGEPFALKLKDYSKEDKEYIAKMLGVTYASFAKAANLQEDVKTQTENTILETNKYTMSKLQTGSMLLNKETGDTTFFNPGVEENTFLKQVHMFEVRQMPNDKIDYILDDCYPTQSRDEDLWESFSLKEAAQYAYMSDDDLAKKIIKLSDTNFKDYLRVTEALFGIEDTDIKLTINDIKTQLGDTSSDIYNFILAKVNAPKLQEDINIFEAIRDRQLANKKHKGEYYADWDEDSASWCVFHTETSKAYDSYSSEFEAKEKAKERNKAQAERFKEAISLKEMNKKTFIESALTYGSKVAVLSKNHLGDVGSVVSINKENDTVIVDLGNHGRHSFHMNEISNIENNEIVDQYATADDFYNDQSDLEEDMLLPNTKHNTQDDDGFKSEIFDVDSLEDEVKLEEATGKGISFKFETNGNLTFTVDEAGKEELQDILDLDVNWDVKFHEFMDRFQANGQLYVVYPEDIGALTDAPILTDQMSHDDGSEQVYGKIWVYWSYEIKDPLEELLKNGYVTFTLEEEKSSSTEAGKMPTGIGESLDFLEEDASTVNYKQLWSDVNQIKNSVKLALSKNQDTNEERD